MGPKVKRQQNDQFGSGRLPYLLAMKTREEACPARHLSGWIWSRSWVTKHRDQLGRMPGTAPDIRPGCSPDALLLGLSRAQFSVGIASSGVTSPVELCPREGKASVSNRPAA